MRWIFLTLITVYFGSNFYVGRRSFQWLGTMFPQISGKAFIIVYTLLALSLVLGFLRLPFGIQDVMRWFASYWTGFYIYLFLFFLLSDAVILIGRLSRLIPSPMPQSVRFFAGLAVVILSVGVVCYGIFNAHRVKTVSYDVDIGLSGEMNIVLVSDLHLGDLGSERRLETIVEMINDLNPDLVCIAGDIFSNGYDAVRYPDKASALLQSIHAPYGVYACFGNHDGGHSAGEMIDFLERSGVRLLKDEHVMIDERMVLLGRLDHSPIGGLGGSRRADFWELSASLDAGLPIVVMDHNPAYITEYRNAADLILAGHTHRGQIFPGSIITGLIYPIDYGYIPKNEENPQVVISQGAGTWMMPIRIGTSNEVVSVTVR
ncbi:MAG: metallophosphoesterase [Oscillospiraceae bacterium]|nr:metallophosphoesterase [Oscillospiraceae bacterium]